MPFYSNRIELTWWSDMPFCSNRIELRFWVHHRNKRSSDMKMWTQDRKTIQVLTFFPAMCKTRLNLLCCFPASHLQLIFPVGGGIWEKELEEYIINGLLGQLASTHLQHLLGGVEHLWVCPKCINNINNLTSYDTFHSNHGSTVAIKLVTCPVALWSNNLQPNLIPRSI